MERNSVRGPRKTNLFCCLSSVSSINLWDNAVLVAGLHRTGRCSYSLVGLIGQMSVSTVEWIIGYLDGIFLSDIHMYRVFSLLVHITAGGDFLGLCDQKSSYKHVSGFGRLRCYGHFLIPVHAVVWTASYGTRWRVMYLTWWLIVCGICNEQLAQFTTERQAVLRPSVTFSKTNFKHSSLQIKGNFTKQTLHLYFNCIMYYAALLFCSVYCQ